MTSSSVRRKLPADYHALAASKGLFWLGPEVPRVQSQTRWSCPCGYEWATSYWSIRSGGCPQCSGKARRTGADYHALARERGIEWIDELPPNNNTKTRWRCPKKHEWETTYANMRYTKYGCPICTNRYPLLPAEYVEIAKKLGYFWIGPVVPNAQTPTSWQCQRGHVWQARYNNLQSGTGCPQCHDMVNSQRVSKLQRQLCKMLRGELNRKVDRYWIDVALEIDGIQIGVEYDCWFWHQRNLERDSERDARLIALGWRILRIKSDDKMPRLAAIRSAIAKLVAGDTYQEIVLPDWGGS